jgi:hypothetical protein
VPGAAGEGVAGAECCPGAAGAGAAGVSGVPDRGAGSSGVCDASGFATPGIVLVSSLMAHTVGPQPALRLDGT